MERPFQTVTRAFSENLDKLKENQRYNFDRSERFMLWIVGFSIGGVSLIVTNLTQFNQTFNHNTVKTVLILLSISIISGIIYRWAFYLFQIQYQGVEFFLQGAFSNNKIMEMEPEDITNEKDIKEIVRRLKMDFDEDAYFILDKYNNSTQEEKDNILDEFKNYYARVGEGVKKEYEFSFNYVKGVFKGQLGLTEKKAESLIHPQSSKKIKLYGGITEVAFFTSCATFVSVIIILCIKF